MPVRVSTNGRRVEPLLELRFGIDVALLAGSHGTVLRHRPVAAVGLPSAESLSGAIGRCFGTARTCPHCALRRRSPRGHRVGLMTASPIWGKPRSLRFPQSSSDEFELARRVASPHALLRKRNGMLLDDHAPLGADGVNPHASACTRLRVESGFASAIPLVGRMWRASARTPAASAAVPGASPVDTIAPANESRSPSLRR